MFASTDEARTFTANPLITFVPLGTGGPFVSGNVTLRGAYKAARARNPLLDLWTNAEWHRGMTRGLLDVFGSGGSSAAQDGATVFAYESSWGLGAQGSAFFEWLASDYGGADGGDRRSSWSGGSDGDGGGRPAAMPRPDVVVGDGYSPAAFTFADAVGIPSVRAGRSLL